MLQILTFSREKNIKIITVKLDQNLANTLYLQGSEVSRGDCSRRRRIR